MTARDSVDRLTSSTGEPTWLVSGYERVKELLADPRLSRSHADPRHPVRMTQPALFGGPMGDPESERRDHLRMRRLLTKSFSARRMESLRPRIDAIVAQVLDRMETAGSPADFHAAVSFPLPGLVMCELLGISEPDRADFLRWSEDATHMEHPARSRAGLQSLWRCLGATIERKHLAPGEDVISDMLAAGADDPAISDDGIAHLASGLLFAGHGSTVAVIDRGALLLLTHATEREALQRNPGLAATAVEEILRFANPLDKPRAARRGGLPRFAVVDIEVDGAAMSAGDMVMFALQDANEDDRVFRHPAHFDVARRENPHLAFSHGLHFCLGASVARMEMQLLFARLLQRFPSLRLEASIEHLRARAERTRGRPGEIPVAW
ncbi:MAG TPA: cytochrome P450 [Actinomycetota bacterium]|nr:cytochrome P450 [Actinomycetota bacterium]